MSIRNLVFVVAVGVAALWSTSAVWSAEEDQAALLKAIGSAKVSLQQGIAQVAKGTEVATEAKYEMENGKLMLSVYTSAKALNTAAEDNGFNEYSGEATTPTWAPKKEVFADLKHIARSAQYHTLLSMTKVTIPDIVKKASGQGTVFSREGEDPQRQTRFRGDDRAGQQRQDHVLRPHDRRADRRLI